jgi:hypothetical protein
VQVQCRIIALSSEFEEDDTLNPMRSHHSAAFSIFSKIENRKDTKKEGECWLDDRWTTLRLVGRSTTY